jgi:hypothetical protein
MADQPSPHDERPVSFTVASTAIPAGVRCGACGRLHLPHRLRPLDHPGSEVLLRCSRCGATGVLDIDPEERAHADVLQAIVQAGGS